MEDLLLNIVKEASGPKLFNLKQSAQEAHDLLCSQCTGLLRSPAHELRSACFKPLRLSLETKRTKLVSLALNGLHKIVRDERFQAGNEPEDDSLWLPAQLLNATSSMLTHCEDTQVHILRVFLGLACGASWALNGRLVMLLLGRCGEAYEVGTQPIRAAAQAAGSQTVTAFCSFLDEECQDILQQQLRHKNSGNSSSIVYSQTSAVACFNEVIPVMQYICSRLEEARLGLKVNDSTVFLLECLLTLVSTLPQTVHSNTHFTTFLWQRFCPALLSLLGTPGDPTTQGLTTNQSKIVYSIGIQLVRLVGSEPALRPVLEALFHRMLLLPGPVRRLEPLRAIRELLRSPGRLADLLLLKNGTQRHAGDDMAIIRLIMDSIEESSQCNDSGIMLASVECVVAMLTSLDSLCRGEGITHEGAITANQRYTYLEQADYKGPLTYQSLARLPKPYRDVVANLRYQSDSDSSGIDGGGRVGDRHTDEEGTESDTSGATEGPEDNGTDSEDSILDDSGFLTSQELQRLQKLPKELHLGRSGIEECNVDVERHNARHFVKTLQNILLPNLLSLRSSIQVDEILQEFASKCCQHNSAQSFEIKTIMNADGIYLATYSALLLNLRLVQLGHYDKNVTNVKVPLTETQFVEEVYGSGVLVYLSATWLSELYQQVLACSLLEIAGYNPNSGQQYALINLLTDVGGLSSNQLLTDWQKLERVHCSPTEPTTEVEAGIKLSRRVLTCCWDSMVTVLSAALEETPGSISNIGDKASTLGLLLPRRAKRMQYKKKIRDNLVTSSLDGLHKAACLSNTLKLQTRSSSILSLLSSAACRQSTGSRLHAAHAQSLDVLLSKGLALGSHSSACWPHVFSACVHVAKLEHTLFSKAGSAQMLMVAQNANTVVTSTTEKLNLSFNLSQDEETCVDVYSFLQSSTSSLNNPTYNETSVADIVNKSGAHNTNHGLLTNVDAAKICCLLSQQVDSLFHEAALKLNLPCLCAFLEELCTSSQRQLFSRSEELPRKSKKWWKRELDPEQKPVATLLLHRIGDVTLKCIRAGRPLVHTMRVWSIVGPHFMEAACHKDRAVSKKAIACIHDAVTALLNEQIELPHFHFNEALFKPFENLLCLELCDFDVQDQIVACLCEFVEANRTEICSGWRPLFGTLRVANTSNNNAAAISEVFKIFLSTDNTLVFANAALDYILCLLTHIRGLETDNETDTDSKNNNNKPGEIIKKQSEIATTKLSLASEKNIGFLENLEAENNKLIDLNPIDLCRESLKYLQNCVNILEMMYSMPKSPTFNMSHRVQIDMDPQLVDSIIPNIDIVNFNHDNDLQISYKILSTQEDLENCEKQNITLAKLDKQSGVLKIWYILIEGLASNTIICARKNQPYALETLFKLLKELIVCPGPNFGLVCINHLLLPMVQNWLRQNSKTQKAWENIGANFKHCCGMATELVVQYFYHLQDDKKSDEIIKSDIKNKSVDYYNIETKIENENPALTLALKQLLLILVECIAQPNENVARLGTSCIRHIISSAGHLLTSHQWEITVTAIHRACAISLNPLRQLTLAFKPNSDSFYGDLATVKVAARKDCSLDENVKLYQLAQQVFVMSSQRECTKCNNIECTCKDKENNGIIDDRSYVFLLYPLDLTSLLNPDLYTIRVPFRNLVVGILAHQMLIQTISSALLQNLNHITPIFNILQIHNYSLRGILNKVNAKHVSILIQCMELSSFRAKEFDTRPGLKFLTQKVGNLNKAANLYTQANTSDVVQIIVLIELCLDGIERYKMTSNDIKTILEEQVKKECSSDLDYIEQFLLHLKDIWENLIKTYINLSLNMDEDKLSENYETTSENIQNGNATNTPEKSTDNQKPFKFSDFMNEEICDINPIIDETDDKHTIKDIPSDSSDDDSKTNKNKIRTKSESYDEISHKKEMLNEFKSRSYSVNDYDGEIDKDTEMKVEAMMEQYRKRKPYHTLPTRVNPFVENMTMPPPQPVPAEIQQQRLLSIRKDAECYKTSYIETIEACLELLGSLPSDRLVPLAVVLENGAQLLTKAPDEKIVRASQMFVQNIQQTSESTISDNNV